MSQNSCHSCMATWMALFTSVLVPPVPLENITPNMHVLSAHVPVYSGIQEARKSFLNTLNDDFTLIKLLKLQ